MSMGSTTPPESGFAPTEGRCSTCSHWSNAEPDWQFDEILMARCTAIKQREEILEPARALRDGWDKREVEEKRLLMAEKAIAVDGSGYYAAIRTAPDFGCVLWKATTANSVGAEAEGRSAPTTPPVKTGEG